MEGSVAKAEIINLDKSGPPIKCMFNPKEYTFAKQNQWTQKNNSGSNVPPLEFGTGQPATLKLQLMFDTYADHKDVRKEYTDAIWELMMVDLDLKDAKSKKARPPKVRFQWGGSWSFDAVITSISQTFTLFLPNGTPVRATLDVMFQQIADAKLFPKQNPSSGGVGGERVWTVHEGDTLAWIAHKELGSTALWRSIAEINHLTSVRDLTPGTVLRLPNA
jgi:nucleoid-associated protein YgaU